jgi:hypothetical protein
LSSAWRRNAWLNSNAADAALGLRSYNKKRGRATDPLTFMRQKVQMLHFGDRAVSRWCGFNFTEIDRTIYQSISSLILSDFAKHQPTQIDQPTPDRQLDQKWNESKKHSEHRKDQTSDGRYNYERDDY